MNSINYTSMQIPTENTVINLEFKNKTTIGYLQKKHAIGILIKLFLSFGLFLIMTSVTFGQTIIWSDDFETDKGWIYTGEFERGTPGGGSGDHGNANPTSAFSGINAIGTDLDGAYANSLANRAYTAVSPVINCSSYKNVTLSFQRWLNVEQSSYDHAYIEISTNGMTWNVIWENDVTIEDNSWSEQIINISSFADGIATVQIRFALGSTDGSWFYSGWNIDDVKIAEYPFDYRTRNDGDWDNNGSWQVLKEGVWENCSIGDYPGSTTDAWAVEILNGHEIDITDNVPFNINSLTINGGNQDSYLKFYSGTTLNVTGQTYLNSNSNNDEKAIHVDAGTFSTGSFLANSNGNNRDAYIRISTGTVTVTGDITLNSTNVRTYVLFTGTGILNVGGNLSGGGITSTTGGSANAPTNGTVNYNGTAAQNVEAFTYYNLELEGNGDFNASGNITVSNDFSISGGGVFNTSNNLTLNGPNYCGGSIQASGGTVTYNTNAVQIIPGTYNILENAGSDASLCGAVTITSNLRLNGGKISLGDYDLTLTHNAVITPTQAFSASNMIETNGSGFLVKESTTEAGFEILYPIGSGGYYNYMDLRNGLTATPVGTGSIKVKAVTGAQGVDFLKKYWEVVSNNLSGISNVHLLFTYDNAEVDGTQADYNPYLDSDGSGWITPDNPTATGVKPFGSTNSSLLDGKWTAGISPPVPPLTWYAYSTDGNWINASSWTLDGASNPDFVNPSAQIPSATDIVVIPSGKKITISAGNNNLQLLQIEVIGKLDLTSSTGHNFGIIKGNGTILLSGNGGNENFPLGTATLFNDATNGGTVELYGTGMTLNTARTFNNLKINLSSGSATLLADYTLNGDLTITKGDFKINDASNTTPLNLSVAKNVLVASLGTITVGAANATGSDAGYGNYHKYFHVFTVGGNFTNQGSVRLTNQSSPVYNARTNTGAVSLVFNGLSNNILSCEGITDLYYLVINKGTDQTYSLTVNATEKDHFSLFGDNNSQWDATDVENPENRKALWIKAGTLILEGFVYIPTLSEGTRDFTIGANAALVLNGANVFVSTTAITAGSALHPAIDYTDLSYSTSTGISNDVNVQAIYVNGTLKINNGTFSTSNTHGIVYRAESTANKLEINGGTVRIGQFRISGDANAADAKMSYVQTGGELYLVENQSAAAIFDLSAALGSFTMSGGTIFIQDLSGGATNAINIACAENNINVTGGTIIVDNSVGDNSVATISTTAPFHNFILRENRGNGVRLLTELTINNDLQLESENFNANGKDISIGSDLIISTGATYTPGANTTTFNGSKESKLYLPSLQIFNNLTLAKSIEGKDLIIASGLPTALQVNGELRIENGIFDHGEYIAILEGSIYLADTIGNATSTGKIYLNGSAQQTLTSVNGCVRNIELDNASDLVLSGNLSITGTFTLTDGVFDINTHRLTMDGPDAVFAGTFTTNNMIQTAGNASDGGISMYLNANQTLNYPIGTNANATVRYTPVVATFTDFSDDGYVQIRPSDNNLNTTNSSGGDLLSYFWRISHSGFSILPTVSNLVFYYAQTDVVGTEGNYVAGSVIDESPYLRSYENEGVNTTNNTITFNGQTDLGFTLENANYTAGESVRFTGTVDTYYSYYDAESGIGNGWYQNWNNAATWDKGSVGSGVHEVPAAGSIVYIMDRARVWGNVIPNAPAEIIFVYNSAEYPVPDQENVPRLQFNTAGTFNLGIVKDTGMISINTTALPTVNADWGEFANNLEAYIMYWGGNITLNDVIQPCPTLMLEGATFNIDQNITINGDLILTGSTVTPLQDINIGRNLYIGAWSSGTFSFPGSGTSVTVTVEGNLDYTYIGTTTPRDLVVTNPGSASTLEHTLIVKGDIIHGNNNTYKIDLYNAANRPAVILELQGNTNNAYYRTSTSVPDLYRIVLNKGSNQTNSFAFDDSFNLNGATSGIDITKALELQNGTLILNDAAIDINLSTGNDDFLIPSTANLTLTQGTARVNGANSGISLDGTLKINGGTLTTAGTENNYIQYGASGTAKIEVTAGVLNVGTQIRRFTTSSAGVLNFIQTGGAITIGVNTDAADYEESRGMLEILNAGSNFELSGGTLTLVRQNGVNPDVAALYLDPTTYNITGSTIVLGNSNTPTEQNNFNINSSIPLNNLTLNTDAAVGDYPNVNLATRPLTVLGDLIINTNATFDAKGLNLTVAGNMINNGTYTASNNTLTFNSNEARNISGSGTYDIYRFTKTGSGTLTMGGNIIVNDLLDVDEGTLYTDSYDLSSKGNVILDGTITSASGNGIVFEGTTLQNLSRSSLGNSNLGIVTIKNNYGVKVSNTGHSFTITNKLRLHNGVFNIGGSLLEFETNATIEEVKSFSTSNMIQTNSSFQDNGVKKNFPTAYTTDFTFPVGQLKYTPVTFDFSSLAHTTGSSEGYITVRPANEPHPSVNDGNDIYPSGDLNNVLQYYWILRAENLTGLSADVIFEYEDSDALAAEAGLSETDYIAARILSNNNPTGLIGKFPGGVDPIAHTVSFSFDAATHNEIAGDYFAGIDAAIPNNVATFTTTGLGGNIDEPESFDGSPANVPPSGAILVVAAGTELNFNVSNVRLYKTVIEDGATLVIDGTSGHRLGTVSGTGDIKIVSNTSNVSFPAGDYIDFFTCTGGGLDYAGTGSYSVMAGLPSVRNLSISGSGTKEIANAIEICDNLVIDGPVLENSSNYRIDVNGNLDIISGTFNSGTNTVAVDGTLTLNGGIYNGETGGTDSFGALIINSGTFNTGSGGSISIQGSLTFSGGNFNRGSGIAKIVLNGTANQNISGNFTGANMMRNLEINNSNGATMLGSITIDNSLLLTNGLITPGINSLLLNANASISPAIGTATSYVNGKLSKTLASAGNSFTFPVGKAGKWGYAGVNNVGTGGLIWDVEYFKTSALNESIVDNLTPTSASIFLVTDAEYWKISDNGSSTATISLSWNSSSGVSADQAEREKLEVMVWDNDDSSWDNYGGGSFSSGHSQTGGSFISTTAIPFSENIITLGSSDNDNPLPVELLYFIGKAEDKTIELFWVTATELNNHYFEIERSNDGLNFLSIGTIYGSGTSLIKTNYSFTDNSPLAGTNYYRLKQVDFDGVSETFNPISINWKNTSLDDVSINVYPNPYSSGSLFIEFSKIEPYTSVGLTIVDIRGKLVYHANLLVPEDQEINLIPMAIDPLNSGVYFIRIQSANKTVTKRLVVN